MPFLYTTNTPTCCTGISLGTGGTAGATASQLGVSTRRLYIGTGGTFIGRMAGCQADVTYVNVPNGSYLDGNWTSITGTGNSCAGIVSEG